MDGEFGFNLEALGKHGHGFHENAIERTVARHHVIECKAINGFDEPANQVIAKAMKRSVVFFPVASVRKTVANGHVGLARLKRGQKLTRRLGGIRVITVDHNVIIGIDVAEH